VFEFVDEYAQSDDLAWTILQFTPQLLMMRTRGRGMAALRDKEPEQAVGLIEEGIDVLEEFYRSSGRENLVEDSGEIGSLRHWLEEIKVKNPGGETATGESSDLPPEADAAATASQAAAGINQLEKLKSALAEAIRLEDYEKAAAVRDQLRKLQASES